jgi:beta-galactosidase
VSVGGSKCRSLGYARDDKVLGLSAVPAPLSYGMNLRVIAFLVRASSATVLLAIMPGHANAAPQSPAAVQPHVFEASGKQFLMDGKPYQVIAGEIHYTRIPREYWRDRFRKARAMGLNTITTYAFWNVHEPKPGVYDFTGQNDIAEFMREAQSEGLNVIFRPGPYVCAEWELGGYPAWLLKDRDVVLRSDEPKYHAAVRAWFMRLGQEIKPLLSKNGGPIIAVQVENEYGAFGNDTAYLEGVKEDIIAAGMGDALLYTSNQAGDIAKGSLPEIPAVVNFGTGSAERSFAKLEAVRPDGPRMTGEYWAGWFDKWGEEHHQTDGQKEAAELRWMLARGYSVSLYLFDGGTTFGWMNGADTHRGTDYHPDTTSYDYDAPIDEHGAPRYKFDLFRKAIGDTTHAKLPAAPSTPATTTYPIAPVMLSASLWRNLPMPVTSKTLLTFEDLGQNYGYVLYRTGLDAGDGGKLVLDGLHDYAQVYIEQQLVGTLDRRLGTNTLDLPRQMHASTLDILVENTGRVNYSKTIRGERAGLTGDVTLDGKAPKNWEIFSLPMDDLAKLRMLPEACSGPCFFQTKMTVGKPADTYLDVRGLHKGQLWIEKHNLGRFWAVGPQHTLYLPAPWLQKGANSVTFFDLTGDKSDHLSTTLTPIFGAVTHTSESQ